MVHNERQGKKWLATARPKMGDQWTYKIGHFKIKPSISGCVFFNLLQLITSQIESYCAFSPPESTQAKPRYLATNQSTIHKVLLRDEIVGIVFEHLVTYRVPVHSWLAISIIL